MSSGKETQLSTVTEVDGRFISDCVIDLFSEKQIDIEQLVESGKSGDASVDLKGFTDLTQWIMMLLIIGIRHAVPETTNKDAIEIGRWLARRLYLPGEKHLWSIAAEWISRRGLGSGVRRVMQELQRSARKPEM